MNQDNPAAFSVSPAAPVERPEKILVVHAGPSSATGAVAKELAMHLGADLEELVDARARGGIGGWLGGKWHALRRTDVVLQPLSREVRGYDLVVVGGPVVGGRLSKSVTSFLTQHGRELQEVVFFVTRNGTHVAMRAVPALRRMGELVRRPALATLSVGKSEVDSGTFRPRCRHFVDAIQHLLTARRLAAAAEQSGARVVAPRGEPGAAIAGRSR